MRLPAVYNASDYEADIYKLWEDSAVFVANPISNKQHYSIPMPPPNETGTLHIGSALFLTLQDILARHARLQDKDVLWLPGTDHAAIATNAVIERLLAEEGTNKHEIGREEFLRRTKEFVANNRDTINKQIRAMGSSVDWTRSRYTLDESLTRCVNEVFTKMYKDDLIYRGNRIVNWDPKLETNVSDDEVEFIQEKGKLYTLKYGPFLIATARPETKFGDKYVVMHPDDKRYKQYKHGEKFEAEWINGKVIATIIKDESVDPEFGTGIMTITPWHSQIDFEIAERHNLDRQQTIDLKGNLMDIAGEFAGMSIEQARPKIVEKLDKKGLLVSVDEQYLHNVGVNSRGKGIIEPQIRLQWFINVNKPVVKWKGKKQSLKQVMQSVVREGDVRIIPTRFNKVYFHWVDNLRDWCISRQIWWGHRIPVWYRQKGSDVETYVGVEAPKGVGWQQDPDTLDTWFSSSLWTWSTLIDPSLAKNYNLSLDELLKNSPDYLAYHPTSVLETGWDILFFWVSRMILSTTYVTGQVPFKDVYLHGLVLNSSGKKMSKSHPDSIIDPLKIIDEFGTDSLRLALIQGTSAGNSQVLHDSKIITNRNFCNKIWNIARYIDGGIAGAKDEAPKPQSLADHWIINQLDETSKAISKDLDGYRFSDAYSQLYHFVWDDLADWYIEASKTDVNKPLLAYALKNVLIIAHPLAPYITETIWQNLDATKGCLLAGEQYQQIITYDKTASADFEQLKQIISETRFILHGIGQKNVTMYHEANNLIDKNRTLIQSLSGVKQLIETSTAKGLKLTVAKINIWLDIDRASAEAYLDKLKLKQSSQQQAIKRLESRLKSKAYIERAPAELITESKTHLVQAKEMLSTINQEIKLFNDL